MTLKEAKVILQPKNIITKKGKIVLKDKKNLEQVLSLIKKNFSNYIDTELFDKKQNHIVNTFLKNNKMTYYFPIKIIKILNTMKNKEIIDVINYDTNRYEIINPQLLYGIKIWKKLVKIL